VSDKLILWLVVGACVGAVFDYKTAIYLRSEEPQSRWQFAVVLMIYFVWSVIAWPMALVQMWLMPWSSEEEK
jgi:multisubunit Na+/H+ antiporter MnhE subunit